MLKFIFWLVLKINSIESLYRLLYQVVASDCLVAATRGIFPPPSFSISYHLCKPSFFASHIFKLVAFFSPLFKDFLLIRNYSKLLVNYSEFQVQLQVRTCFGPVAMGEG